MFDLTMLHKHAKKASQAAYFMRIELIVSRSSAVWTASDCRSSPFSCVLTRKRVLHNASLRKSNVSVHTVQGGVKG